MEAHSIVPPEPTNATKERIDAEKALALASDSSDIWAARGKKITKLKPSDEPEDLSKAMVGPSGNLRAPTLRVGKKLIVGFNPEMYAEIFKIEL